MRRKVFIVLTVLLIGTSIGFIAIQNTDSFYQVRRSVDIFGTVFKDVVQDYVDPVPPEQLVRKGINAINTPKNKVERKSFQLPMA